MGRLNFEIQLPFFDYSPSSHLNRFKIISLERFHVHEHFFSKAGLLLKYLIPSLGCQQDDSPKEDRDILTRDQPCWRCVYEHKSALRKWLYIYLNGTTVNNHKSNYVLKFNLPTGHIIGWELTVEIYNVIFSL